MKKGVLNTIDISEQVIELFKEYEAAYDTLHKTQDRINQLRKKFGEDKYLFYLYNLWKIREYVDYRE